MATAQLLPGQRGPVDHAMRERVVDCAHAMFRAQGFARTSVAEIAADLDVAPTYLYKFFQSKTAIGEAVCGGILREIDDALWAVAHSSANPTEKITRLFGTMLKESVGMFFAERKLHDLVAHSLEQNWSSIGRHQKQIREVVAHIIDEGIEKRAFDSSLDRAEAIEALFWALHPFAHPRILEQSIDQDLEARARIIGRFCVRALQCGKASKVTD
jgi:AcrR family transcriptional regulator